MTPATNIKCPKCNSLSTAKGPRGRRQCECGYSGYEKFFLPVTLAEIEKAENDKLNIMRRHIKGLEAQVKNLTKESVTTSAIRQMIGKINAQVTEQPPKWVFKLPPNKKVVHGIPSLMLSDLHQGEVIYASQVGGVNEYNTKIFKRRLARVVEGSIKLLRQTLSPGYFGGMVVILGGDMIEGVIHDELRETSDQTVFQALVTTHDALIPHLKLLADEFGRLYMPCVPGNHGRLDRKPRKKNGPLLNFDWLLYQFLARTIGADPVYRKKITFQIPDGFDASYRIYNTRYLLTHGDKFTGGNGITGPLLPWMRGDMKTRKQYSAMGKPYDVLVMGHWHQLRYLEGIIVNGCLPGFNEYAMSMGFGYEPPQQALWLTHPSRGITFREAIWADDPKPFEESDWVSVRSSMPVPFNTD